MSACNFFHVQLTKYPNITPGRIHTAPKPTEYARPLTPNNVHADEEAIEYLSQLKQIGRWSAEMILMFTFNRPNIWPILDLGLQKAISKNYKKKYLAPRSFVEKLHKKFSPMCTIAVWYLWRSIDNDPIQY